MQKIDFRRLISEVRPTFVPYARFKVRTHLTPEQCQERLASATQSQRMLTLFSARTSSDTRLTFKGQISKKGFIAVPVDHKGRRRYQGPQPFWILGSFRPTFGGTYVVVQVFPDLLGLLVACVMFGAFYVAAIAVWQSSMLEKLVYGPVSLVALLLCYAILAFPVSFKAHQTKKTLEKLFH